jgi:hypothetical protein
VRPFARSLQDNQRWLRSFAAGAHTP